ncbi:MAG: VWA domain-containing protein [Polyangiaceae bacterium]|nr:VWA domain-containing protein [Polyangiaceae bacterium]
MQKVLSGLLMVGWLAGCSSATTVTPEVASPETPKRDKTVQVAADPVKQETRPDTGEREIAASGTWIGASGASDFVLTGTNDTFLGVWVDVPSNIKKIQAPAAVSVVIDTSGSMAGPKMEHARSAAKSLIDKLPDGDIVSVITFDDAAQERVPPTMLDGASRQRIRSTISELAPNGSTNMFDGLRQGEARAMSAPNTHAIRRVVLISDGIANIGPSTPELLGELAARGAERGVQVTAVGVGLDYDENTLNALAIRSSGRLHHMAETHELPAILEKEMALLKATAVTNAVVEVIPAPGVQLLGADGVRSEWVTGGGLRVPLGTLFGGQHREMLMRVRVTAAADGTHPLASVRLHFTDPSEGNLARVQEVIARYTATADNTQLERHANARTQSIIAVQEAGRLAVQAAQSVNQGSWDKADKDLAVAEEKLRETAKQIRDAKEKKRVEDAAARMATARKKTQAAAAAPAAAKPAAKRSQALDLNASGMKEMGY